MVHYKLTYFDARGLGDVPRQLFHLAGVEFEDHRLSVEEFKKLKPSFPFEQVPVLYVDGFEIPQSSAIGRYLARKFGYAGKTSEEEALVDGAVDLFKDFIPIFRTFSTSLFFGKSTEEIEKGRSDVNTALGPYFAKIIKLLDKSKSGYLVGNSLTWADLQIVDNLTSLKINGFFDGERKLDEKIGAFYEKVMNYPKLKEYFEKRPHSIL